LATRGDEPLPLGRRSQRLLLGLLLLEAGRPVPVDRIGALLWDDDPPLNVRASLHTHMSRLRGVLDPYRDGSYGIRLLTIGDTYLANIPTGAVDVHRFRTTIERGLTLPDTPVKTAMLRHAVKLWRGPLLADVSDDALRHRIGAGLEELRLNALQTCIDSDLAAGQHRRATVELTELVQVHPTRESLIASLMLALYRDGRGPDALQLYRDTRARFANALGVDPGPELRRLHHAILRTDPALNLDTPTTASPPPVVVLDAESTDA
jgi:DNA-binding SARP family transcriptional activator